MWRDSCSAHLHPRYNRTASKHGSAVCDQYIARRDLPPCCGSSLFPALKAHKEHCPAFQHGSWSRRCRSSCSCHGGRGAAVWAGMAGGRQAAVLQAQRCMGPSHRLPADGSVRKLPSGPGQAFKPARFSAEDLCALASLTGSVMKLALLHPLQTGSCTPAVELCVLLHCVRCCLAWLSPALATADLPGDEAEALAR